jgi:hypothetical protein
MSGCTNDEDDAFVCVIMPCWCLVSNANTRRKEEM